MREGARSLSGRFGGSTRALVGIITLLLACALSAYLTASARATVAEAGAVASTSAARPLSAPRNLVVRRRTGTSITLRWLRARGAGRPHVFLVFVNGRQRVLTRRKGATATGLRCGTRYRIDVATRDRRGRTSRRKTRMVRTSRCVVMRRSPGAQSGTPGSTGAAGSSQNGSGAAIPGSIPGTGTAPGGGIPPGGGTSPGVGPSLPARLPQSSGATYHVATSGSDSAAGSEAAPWRTVQKALNTLAPGQAALVHAGVYAQDLELTRAGSASAPITIRNAPGEQAILRPSSGSGDGVPLSLGRGAAYARFYGLVFEGATGSSTTNIYAYDNAHDIEISGCEDRGSARQGFFSEASVSRIHIIGCYFHGNGGSGPAQQDHNIYLQGSENAVLGNLITGAVNGYGVQIYPSSDHALIAGNTITDNFRDGIVIGSGGGTTTTDALVVNNIIAGNRAPVSSFWGGAAGSNNVVRNNLVWGNGSNGLSAGGLTVSGTITADPLFANAGAGDFHLSAGSPALGAADIAYVLPADIDGDARPLGSGPDLGAFER